MKRAGGECFFDQILSNFWLGVALLFLIDGWLLCYSYGEIQEVWLDGAKGEGEKDMDYLFNCWFEVIHQLQPGAVIFSDAGPDTRWVGDEAGVAGTTCWSLFNQSSVTIGHTDDE